MRVKVLGCSGGIGGKDIHTTSLLIDEDVLIDAGTGVAELPIEALAKIDRVFLTHTHLDHIACLPLLVDTVTDMRTEPLQVYGTAAVIASLRQHIFNWSIWPDFSEIPSADAPTLKFVEIREDCPIELGRGRRITPWPANHTVPAVSYGIESDQSTLAFSGDTANCPAFWERVNRLQNLRYLIMECAFPDRQADLARAAKHHCPQTLVQELAMWQRPVELYITHLKPGLGDLIMNELQQSVGAFKPRMLENNWVFEL